MARKNMGKVKHYNHSFYTGGQRVRRLAGTLALLAALFLAGWLVGPAVIDFGTSTWYKMKHKIQDKPVSSQSQSVTSQPAGTDENTAVVPQETPPPQETPAPQQNPGEGGWSFVSVTAARDAQQASQTARQLAKQGVKYAVLPFKDSQGHVYYNSTVEKAKPAISSTVFDPAAAAAALKEQGIIPVAAISVFRDPIAAGSHREMAVKYQNQDYLWLDAARDKGGQPWLNPASAQAVQYICDLIEEAKALGFEEIWLNDLQFPTEAGRSKANFGDMGGRNMSEVLKDALGRFQQLAPCWVQYPLEQVSLGVANPVLGAEPAALGVQRLVLYAEGIEDPAVLEQAVSAARSGGVSVIALNDSGSIELQ